jgi:Transcriptional regulators containing a DNA-binding HTH domain and an aminotransferase domain (MocR family) and their eukaryotic orthologs
MSKTKEIKKDTILKHENDTWVNQRTGEVIETVEIMKPINRQGFMITYLETIIDLIETIGNKKMQIIRHILSNMDKSTNTYLTSTRELAEKTGSSTRTITETLKLLEEKSIIQRRLGAIMINPKLVHRGSNNKEKALITRFYDFKGGDTDE